MRIGAAVLGALLAGAVATAAFGQSPPQTARDGPHRLLVSSGDVTAEADGGWGCWFVSRPDGSGSGVCADPPARQVGWVPTSSVPAPVNGELVIEAGARVDQIDVRMGPTRLAPRALDGSGRRFAVTLPPATRGPVLSVTIRYSGFAREDGSVESGTLTFEIAVRKRKQLAPPGAVQRVAPTRVTVRSTARCKAGPRRTRCRFVQSGRVLRPAGSAADCAGGRIRIRVLAGAKALFRARARTTSGCRYRVTARFRPRPGLTALKVTTRFLGTPSLGPESAKPRTVRIKWL
jgi:hypothetical protein